MTDLPILTDNIRILENAIVCPPQKRGGPAGVLTCDGAFVEESREYISYFEPVPSPSFKDIPPDIPFVKGTYLYGGWIQPHFGHTIVETVARLWPLPDLQSQIDGIVIIQRGPNSIWRSRRANARLLSHFYLGQSDLPTRSVTKFERLIVPDAGTGLGARMNSSAGFRQYVRQLTIPEVDIDLPESIYISRRKLPGNKGRMLGETRLWELLQANGYWEMHPQELNPDQQIAMIANAKRIVSPDGTPMHVVSYFANPTAKVAMIIRRNRTVPIDMESQFRTIQRRDLVVIDRCLRIWKNLNTKRAATEVLSEVDLVGVADDLTRLGFITNGNKIANLNIDEVKSEFAVHRRLGMELSPLDYYSV